MGKYMIILSNKIIENHVLRVLVSILLVFQGTTVRKEQRQELIPAKKKTGSEHLPDEAMKI